MVRRRILTHIVLAAVVAAGWAGAAGAFEAGAAKIDITPPLETPLNGYGARMGRGAVAVHDPIWVRCLYLDDGQTRVFLVNADLCIINHELREEVLARAPAEVPRENIILTATHNHSGTGGMVKSLLFRSISGRFMPEILETTAEGFAEAMRTAYAARKRATIGYGAVSQKNLSRNRRVSGGPTDEQIGVIRVNDSDGNALAIVGNLAAHPTCVPSDDGLAVSADYPGVYYEELERLANPGCVAMFLQGAGGNQSCANPDGASGWGQVEAIGKLLATAVKGAANEIVCREATLRVAHATVDLPRSISTSMLPPQTFLQVLEIDELLLAFFPGEPCVELGLELRRRSLERGYRRQFSVGLANDHLMYFIPRERYCKNEYESAMNFYGPAIEDFFYREFSLLMSRGEPEPVREPGEPPPMEWVAGVRKLTLAGTPYQVGYARGAAFREYLQTEYQRRVVAECDTGRLRPTTGLWAVAPGFVDLTALALWQLSTGVRPLLDGLSPELLEEIEGIADGAEMPFDAVWMLHCTPTLAAQDGVDGLYRLPFCTMAAATGIRAGADDLIVGRNLDWADPEELVVLDIRPETGRRAMMVAFPWTAGTFTGMNDAGIVVCAERVESQGTPGLMGPPVELVLREVLRQAATLDQALDLIKAAEHLRGYHILVGDPAAPRPRVVECGETRLIREPAEDMLLGIIPDGEQADEDARARYGRMAELLRNERIVAPHEMGDFLHDRAPDATGRARILNEDTRYSVVFEPKTRRLHLAFPQEDGSPGEYVALDFEEAAP